MNRSRNREQKPKTCNNVRCMECGTSSRTLRKIKKPSGGKGYICKYCFDTYYKGSY